MGTQPQLPLFPARFPAPSVRVAWTPLVWVAVAAWVLAVGGGFAWLSRYKSTPGTTDPVAPARWPEGSAIARDPHRPTLVMFAHPHCPCTRASVSELARLASALPGRFASRVVFLRPGELGEGWEQTDLWRTVGGIDGAVAVLDADGEEARRFDARTSGLVLLYDRDGGLQFAGGLTASRGHEGDSFGRQRIVSILATGSADRRDSPVFGCALGAHGP